MAEFLINANEILWGNILVIIIPIVGIYFSIRFKLVQIKHLKTSLILTFKGGEEGEGDISPFASLCTTLGATIGTGNIVGVAAAVLGGGAGALFWMEISAILGMAIKYAEGVLAVKFREKSGDNYLGGPFYYIEKGLGKSWRWLGYLFCVFGIAAGLFGIGTLTQINSITEAVQSFFDPQKNNIMFTGFGNSYTYSAVIGGAVSTLLAALLILGGIKRISKFSELLIPAMSVVYIVITVIIILANYKNIPPALVLIVKSAFSPRAVGGAAVGITFKTALTTGFSKGIFSNEAGLGSAPIAAAAAKTREPVQQGLITMVSAFIDTTVLCTLSGLAVILTNAQSMGGNGVEITVKAWTEGLPFPNGISSFLLNFCLVFFSFATIPGWSYYAESCLNYITKGSEGAIKLFRIIYIMVVALGPYIPFNTVWLAADFLNGLMALPNLIALILLAGTVKRETTAYFSRIENASNRLKE